MGYTHYARITRHEATKSASYEELRELAEHIVRYANNHPELRTGSMTTSPAEASVVGFRVFADATFPNGECFALTGECESLIWPPNDELKDVKDWLHTFCKTQRHAYDAAVCACLLAAKRVYGAAVTVSSDGGWDDWLPGRMLYHAIFGEPAACPFDDA